MSRKALVIGVPQDVFDFLEGNFVDVEINSIKTEDGFFDIWENIAESDYAFILCGSNLDVDFTLEIAKLVSCELPMVPLYFVGNSPESIRLEDMKRDGFWNTYLFPIDERDLREELGALVSDSMGKKRFRPIELVSIMPEISMPFDVFVFLPLNKRYLKYFGKGKNIGETRLGRLKSNEVSTLFIEYGAVEDFANFSADFLQNMMDVVESSGSVESREILRKAIRALFLSIFDDQEEDQKKRNIALDNCKKIISSFLSGGSDINVYSRFASAIGGVAGHYNHATTTSVLATLIGMAVEFENPEDLSVAGFFHDIALWNADYNLDPNDLAGKRRKDYESHPTRSLGLLKQKKITVSELAIKIIEQHHERFDGKGFPNKVEKGQVLEGAQILSFADQLEYLTSYKINKRKFKLIDALKVVGENGSISPTLYKKVLLLVRPPETEIKAA